MTYNDIPPALQGMVQQAADEQPWTDGRRDEFVAVLYSVLDFVFPVVGASDFRRLNDQVDRILDDVDGTPSSVVTHGTEGVRVVNDTRVNWAREIGRLTADVDVFSAVKKTVSASTIREHLIKTYPGLDVTTSRCKDPGMTSITVTIGTYTGS